MYKNLILTQAVRLINAGSCVLLSCGCEKFKDITPVAWNMPVNDEPPIVAAALDSNHFITELILKNKDFCINIPDMDMLDTVLKCGSVSGRKGDKFDSFSIQYEKCEKINSVMAKNCAGYLECRLKGDLKYSGVDMIVADVLSAKVKKEFFDESWITDKFKSIHSVGSMYGASLGERFKF